MKPRQRAFDIFSLSFLDVISCGFGAVVLLVLISDFSEAVLPGLPTRTEALLRNVLAERRIAENLRAALEREHREAAARERRLARLQAEAAAARKALEAGEAERRALDENLAGLTLFHF